MINSFTKPRKSLLDALPKVATIVPAKHLELISGHYYFLALSHACEDYDYLKFFATMSALGKFIILDNSAVELGEPEPFKDYLEKAIAIRASQVILPDFFQNPDQTLKAAWEAIEQLAASDYQCKIMVVPQGHTMTEWVMNAYELLEVRAQSKNHGLVYPTTLGASCRYTDLFGPRSNMFFAMTQRIGKFNSTNLNMHFLGCYMDPVAELSHILGKPEVQGIDSSYPSVYARHHMLLTTGAFRMPRPPRDIDFINDEYNADLLKDNIDAWVLRCSEAI